MMFKLPLNPDGSAAPQLSAWAPLRHPVFRMLWSISLTANICMWMNNIAAAWLMTLLTPSPVMVALVQSAASLPMFLLGLPSGAIADIVDRRRFLLLTQFWVAANGMILCVASWTGYLNATMLLVLTAANGIGLAMRMPVFSAIVPGLVPREELPTAMALNAMAMNASRIVGPILAGALIAAAGSAYVFLLNATLSLIASFLVLRWRQAPLKQELPGEHILGAMRVGIQYVRRSPGMRSAIFRCANFALQSTALIALLPLEAKRLHDGGASIYTVLLSALGVGAILAGSLLPRLRQRLNRNQLVQLGMIAQGVAMIVLSVAPNLFIAAPAMVLAGMGWITVANSLAVSARLSLPNWVRARGMSIFQMTMMGGTAISAALWGKVADMFSVQVSLIAAAVTGMLLLLATRKVAVSEESGDELTPAPAGVEPVAAFPIDPHIGPIVVTVEYLIDPSRAADFAAVMQESKHARLRYGARSWSLLHDTSAPDRYVEYFVVSSWVGYLRHLQRLTEADAALRKRRLEFHIGNQPPRVTTYVDE